MVHLLMENESGLLIDAVLTPASGSAERETALTMLGRLAGRHPATLGADKARPRATPSSGLPRTERGPPVKVPLRELPSDRG
jgi:hypothetical protein